MQKLSENRYMRGVQAVIDELDRRHSIGMGKLTNRAHLADHLGITRQALSQWTRVPYDRVLDIEQALGVPRHVMRPDIYPPTTGRHERKAARAAAR